MWTDICHIYYYGGGGLLVHIKVFPTYRAASAQPSRSRSKKFLLLFFYTTDMSETMTDIHMPVYLCVVCECLPPAARLRAYVSLIPFVSRKEIISISARTHARYKTGHKQQPYDF